MATGTASSRPYCPFLSLKAEASLKSADLDLAELREPPFLSLKAEASLK